MTRSRSTYFWPMYLYRQTFNIVLHGIKGKPWCGTWMDPVVIVKGEHCFSWMGIVTLARHCYAVSCDSWSYWNRFQRCLPTQVDTGGAHSGIERSTHPAQYSKESHEERKGRSCSVLDSQSELHHHAQRWSERYVYALALQISSSSLGEYDSNNVSWWCIRKWFLLQLSEG